MEKKCVKVIAQADNSNRDQLNTHLIYPLEWIIHLHVYSLQLNISIWDLFSLMCNIF